MFFAKMEVIFSPLTTEDNATESHYFRTLAFFPSTSKFSMSSSSQYDFTSMITLTITIPLTIKITQQ